MEQVNLVDDDQIDERTDTPLRLASNNVPLLRRAHNNLKMNEMVDRANVVEIITHLCLVHLLLA